VRMHGRPLYFARSRILSFKLRSIHKIGELLAYKRLTLHARRYNQFATAPRYYMLEVYNKFTGNVTVTSV